MLGQEYYIVDIESQKMLSRSATTALTFNARRLSVEICDKCAGDDE